MNKTFRLTMLCLLCGGLLLIGVGVGIGLIEYAGFSYAGQRLPEQAQNRTQTLTVELNTEDFEVCISSWGGALYEQLRETARIQTSPEVEPNTARFDLGYDTVGPTIAVTGFMGVAEYPQQDIVLGWSSRSDLAVLMACKDQILDDLKNRRVGDYITARLTAAVITVNPADAARVRIQ